MNTKNRIVLFLFAILISACGDARKQVVENNSVYQFSVINALLDGDYDGSKTFANLAKKGTLGLGTFNALDGEMIALDGQFYQVKSNGKVYHVADTMRTPFAVVTDFKEDMSLKTSPNLSYVGLTHLLDSVLPTENLVYALKITGKFATVRTRSVPRQQRPYRKLVEVAKEQQVFEYENVSGTLVGFRLPPFMKGVNVPGYHLHFLSADKQKGGHLLTCEIDEATVLIDSIRHLDLELSDSKDFYGMDLKEDKHEELKKVEK